MECTSIESMSIKELKEYINSAGLPVDDCIEKHELQARAGEAWYELERQQSAKAAQPRRTSAADIPKRPARNTKKKPVYAGDDEDDEDDGQRTKKPRQHSADVSPTTCGRHRRFAAETRSPFRCPATLPLCGS